MTQNLALFNGRNSVRTNKRSLYCLTSAAAALMTVGAYAQSPKPIFPIPSIPATLDGAYIGPGRGLTKDFEIQFIESTIDHHFSALRMTELAVGTDPQRSSAISPTEGVAQTPGYPATQAKATLDDLKSLARRANRTQREQILTLQSFLRNWYGISYQPKLTPDGEAGIDVLEAAATGKQFDKKFYETFSRHHYTLLDPLNQCITGSELLHPDLMSLCNEMWHSQTADITTMRRDLARHYGIVDYQPFVAPSGQHTSPDK